MPSISPTTNTDQKFRIVCLIIGQVLLTTSSFFWDDHGRYTITGSVLDILAMLFWLVGFTGLFDLVKEKSPWYARIGLLYAFYGCMGGIAFGFEGLYSMLLANGDKIGVEAYQHYPFHMNLVLFWPGPAFPISLLVLGIFFVLKKITPAWIALLIIAGAISFPVSRIFRIEWVAITGDLILLLPIFALGFRLWSKHQTVTIGALDQ